MRNDGDDDVVVVVVSFFSFFILYDVCIRGVAQTSVLKSSMFIRIFILL